jgi:hypothetical protein
MGILAVTAFGLACSVADFLIGRSVLTRAMDGLDRTVRTLLPEVVDVFIDVTAYRLDTPPTDPTSSSK